MMNWRSGLGCILSVVTLVGITALYLYLADRYVMASAPRPPAGPIMTASATPTVTGSPLTATPTFTPTPSPTPTITGSPLTSTPTWTPTPPICWGGPPAGGLGFGGFQAMAARDPNDVWAVGYFDGCGGYGALVSHWDGTQWSNLTTPFTCGNQYRMWAVGTAGVNEAWVIGWFAPTLYDQPEVIFLHCSATACTVVSPPPVGGNGGYLYGASGVAPNDVWAVGSYALPGDMAQTLIEHWNGTTWSVVPSPNVAGYNNTLSSVVALASNDVWAVGSFSNITTHPLIVHWDGVAWLAIGGPDTGSPLNSVSAASPSDIWAVGDNKVEHWNGSVWSVAPSPPFGGLGIVAAGATGDVWVLGSSQQVAHWNGQEWSLVPTPLADATHGLAAAGPMDAWLAGRDEVFENEYMPWAARYDGCGIPFPTPGGPTQTPTLTSTRTPPPTITLTTPPTTTRTPHPGQFEDVPPDNTFYEYIECMGTRGIISGYPCGGPGEPCYGPPKPYFRPNNNVTRGQVSKMISLAAAWTDLIPSTQQTFRDVPVGGTFWIYIERMASRGIIQGYPCGGPFEPCPGNYFRPNNNLTRGQLAKIDALAAGFTETPVGHTFADVPPGSTFYPYIQQVANRGIISGYPCGGPGEPCLPPISPPYFRPNNNVTRGQTAKIVTSSFFPGCQDPTPTPTAISTPMPPTVTVTPTP